MKSCILPNGKKMYNNTKNGDCEEQVVVKARSRCEGMVGEGRVRDEVIKHLTHQELQIFS